MSQKMTRETTGLVK